MVAKNECPLGLPQDSNLISALSVSVEHYALFWGIAYRLGQNDFLLRL